MKINFCLDSGAYTLWNKHVANVSPRVITKTRAPLDWAFFDTIEFNEYFEAYVLFCKEHAGQVEFYVTLDAIRNPELTWKLAQRMESHRLRPMPVIHFGEDITWLKRYIEAGHGYIGMGGLGQRAHVRNYLQWAEPLFRYAHSRGIKIHGFAMTSFRLLSYLPWHSVDSTVSFSYAWIGTSFIPRIVTHKGKHSYDFLCAGNLISFTEGRKGDKDRHYVNLPKSDRLAVDGYLDSLGWTAKQLADVQLARAIVNLEFSRGMEAAIQQQRGRYLRIYQSAGPGVPWQPYLAAMLEQKLPEFNFMGTFHSGARRWFTQLLDHAAKMNRPRL